MQVQMNTANANRKEIICIRVLNSPRAQFSDLGSYISSPRGNQKETVIYTLVVVVILTIIGERQ
jgi:hypothetical protein